jgi:hypothetical protein
MPPRTRSSRAKRLKSQQPGKVNQFPRKPVPNRRANSHRFLRPLQPPPSLRPPPARRRARRKSSATGQLIVYRAFFEPGVFGWPEHACRGCSLGADQIAHLAHLNARDTTLAYASRARQADIARLKARMGWEMPWYSITDSFDADFGVDEWHGHNVFFRDGERVFRTYFINGRGDEAMGTAWSYLDICAA